MSALTADIHWRRLSVGPLEDALGKAMLEFRALPTPAGEDAEGWLHGCVSSGGVPMETQLALSPSGEVLGYYAMEPTKVRLAKDDSIILRLRRLKSDSSTQPASLVAWIARSRSSGAGFGGTLVSHALINARGRGSVAIVVTPRDKRTEQLWVRKHHFMRFKDDPTADEDTSPRLWHPVNELDGVGGWPS